MSRFQIRVAVCRCFRGAFRSSRNIPSIASLNGPSFGATRSGTFRRGGSADCNARRTVFRPTPYRAASLRVPTPSTRASRLILANRSIRLSTSHLDSALPVSTKPAIQVVPNQTDTTLRKP
jgi:hypothetical protein